MIFVLIFSRSFRVGVLQDSIFRTSALRFCCNSEISEFVGFYGGPSEADLDKADPVSRPGDKGRR